jgi:mxaJ protein
MAFNQSIAVRKGDQKLMNEINAALDKIGPKIHEILKDEGIPLLAVGPSAQKDTPSKS